MSALSQTETSMQLSPRSRNRNNPHFRSPLRLLQVTSFTLQQHRLVPVPYRSGNVQYIFCVPFTYYHACRLFTLFSSGLLIFIAMWRSVVGPIPQLIYLFYCWLTFFPPVVRYCENAAMTFSCVGFSAHVCAPISYLWIEFLGSHRLYV